MNGQRREPALERFRRLLRFLPSDFRSDFADEMEETFELQLRDAQREGRTAVRRLWWKTLSGLVTTAPREHWDVLRQDLRWSWRSLRRSLGSTVVAVLTIGLGAGLATTIFSVADGVLRRPLPYPEPEALVRIWETQPSQGIDRIGASKGNAADWRERVPELVGVAGTYTMGRTLLDEAGAEVVLTAQVSTDFFSLLGVPALMGRTFTAEETDRSTFNSASAPTGAEPVVVLSHRLWRGRFGADPSILDRTITLDRRGFRVVGVMPPGFAMPGPEVELWIPWSWTERRPRDQHYLEAIARLRPGSNLEAAQSRLDTVSAELAKEHPKTNSGWAAKVVPLHGDLTAEVRPALVFLTVAASLLLALAVFNVAGLQLVQASGRLEELTIRKALGASPSRIVRQLLSESLLLGTAGAALAVAVAAGALEALPSLWSNLPRLAELQVDATVLLVAVIASAGAAAVGAIPALRIGRDGDTTSLRIDGGRSTAGPQRTKWRRRLVVCEILVAVVLLVGAGLLLRSFSRLTAIDPGFNPRGVLVAPIFLDNQAYTSGSAARSYYARLFERLAGLPGVESVGGATALPASPLGPDFERPVWAAPTRPNDATVPHADVRMVTPDYFRTLEIPVHRGRPFAAADGPEASSVVIVNERLAERVWPGEDPVGRRIVVDYSTSGTYPYEVVGVVGDVRFRGPRSEPRSEIYFPHAQRPYLILNVAIKTSAPVPSTIAGVHRVLREIDQAQPPQQVTPLRDLVASTISRDRLATQLLGGFALAAVLLAALGIYGVLAHRVSQGRAEIGVRLALGARPWGIARDIVLEGTRLAVAGAALGSLVSLAAGTAAAGLLFEIAPTDLVTFGVVVTLVLVIALTASYVPARRAARVDPSAALR